MQATAIIESTRSAHRLKLDLTLHAPVIELPFYTKDREGNIYIDLGEFQISNRLLLTTLSSTYIFASC